MTDQGEDGSAIRDWGALVIGEALIDEVVAGAETSRHVGGSPANVAIGLGRLGVPTRLHTAIGDDADGAMIRRHLDDSGVTLTETSVVNEGTSTAVATLSSDGSASYRFSVRWDPAPLTQREAPTLVHAGSLGAFLSPGSAVTGDLIAHARANGSLITFDPNIRPALMPDRERIRVAFDGFVSRSHLVKLSDEDADFLFAGMSSETVLDHLVESGAAVAAITLGAGGAHLASGSERVRVAPAPIRVADTVGAGDSFMAALIWALAFDGEGWRGTPISSPRLEDIGRVAVQAAGITVSRPGADPPYLTELRARRGGE